MTVDGLSRYGMTRMSDAEIEGFLSSQSVGVLGLATEDVPLLRPMSFSYDGDDRLYFLYVLGDDSRKAAATERAERARFLVYRAETPFNWRSVLLTGSVGAVPEPDRETARDALTTAWRPDLFEQASAAEHTALYQLRVDEREGIKHLGLPPEFEADAHERSGE